MLSNEDETYSAVRCIEQQLETSRSDDRMQSPSVGNRTEERKELNTEGDSHNSDLGKINETLRSAENPSRESALFENVTFERSAGSRPPEEGNDVGEETASEDVVYCGTVDLEQASIELMERLLETIDDTDVASSSVNDVLTSADEALNENSAIYLSSDSEEVSTVDEEESERFNKRSTELVDDGEEETSQSCAYVDDIIGFDDTDRNSEWPLTDEHITHKSGDDSRVSAQAVDEETPSTSASGHDEGDDDEDPAEGLKMFTRSMGEPSNEKVYSAAFRLPTNLEIRQGEQYQCSVESLEEWGARYESRTVSQSPDRDICVWCSPDENANNAEIDAYLSMAHTVHEAEADEALYILQSCHYDIATARKQLSKRTLLKQVWSDDDVSLFLRSFRKHGKKFREIRRWMPHKSMPEIINFYYDNKKRLRLGRILDELVNDDRADSSDESTSDESQKEVGEEAGRSGACDNCGHEQDDLENDHGRYLCDSCAAYSTVLNYQSPPGRPKRPKPASGFTPGADMVEIFTELAKSKKMAEISSIGTEQSTSNALVDEYRRTFCGHKKRFETERKTIETRAQCFRMMQENDRQCKEHLALGVEKYRALIRAQTQNTNRIPIYEPIWDLKDSIYAITAFKYYDKDFKEVAAVVGTKSPIMVKEFYERFREHIDRVTKRGKDLVEWEPEKQRLKKNGVVESSNTKLFQLE